MTVSDCVDDVLEPGVVLMVAVRAKEPVCPGLINIGEPGVKVSEPGVAVMIGPGLVIEVTAPEL